MYLFSSYGSSIPSHLPNYCTTGILGTTNLLLSRFNASSMLCKQISLVPQGVFY